MTADEQRGVDIAHRVRTGTIGVSHYQIDLGSPFGGMTSSGSRVSWGRRD